jgi:CDP-diacylglycerol pyrophosphatase
VKTSSRIILIAIVLLALAAGIYLPVQIHRRDALRRIVQQQCLPHFRQHGSPAPCVLVIPAMAGADTGYAILHDRKGGAHFLLIPTRTITGIESAVLIDPAAPDYVAIAWQQRQVLEQHLHRPLPRDAVGLAINPHTARGQDQLHIHMECVGEPLYHTLQQHRTEIGESWMPLSVGGWTFVARRLMGDGLEGANPIQLLAREVPDARRNIGRYTLIVAGQTFATGPGVIILAGTDRPGGETLLDPTCAAAA